MAEAQRTRERKFTVNLQLRDWAEQAGVDVGSTLNAINEVCPLKITHAAENALIRAAVDGTVANRGATRPTLKYVAEMLDETLKNRKPISSVAKASQAVQELADRPDFSSAIFKVYGDWH
ncbi:MAG: hypothetical protein V1703_04940, partial [Candidatus Altiarchaeota archaeon]